jgi:hypothetical protein
MDYSFDRPVYLNYNEFNTPAKPLSSALRMTRNYGGFFIAQGRG